MDIVAKIQQGINIVNLCETCINSMKIKTESNSIITEGIHCLLNKAIFSESWDSVVDKTTVKECNKYKLLTKHLEYND